MEDINKVQEHKETKLIRFDTHSGFHQSEENKCMRRHSKDDVIFNVCSQTLILFLLTKTTVRIEMYQLNTRVAP